MILCWVSMQRYMSVLIKVAPNRQINEKERKIEFCNLIILQ